MRPAALLAAIAAVAAAAVAQPLPESSIGAMPLPRVVGMIGPDVLWHPVTVRGLQTTKWTHVRLDGVYVRRSEIEDDGDYHVVVSESPRSPCTKADIAQGACAVLEVPPYLQNTIPRPRKGDRIDAAGVSRCDRGHGAIIFGRCTWAEIHPVVQLTIRQKDSK